MIKTKPTSAPSTSQTTPTLHSRIRRSIAQVATVATVATVVLLALCSVAHAATGAVPQGSVDDVIGTLATYGPVIGGMYVLYAVASSLVARYRATSWFAQGKRLAIATSALGIAGAAIQAQLVGSPWTVVLAAAVAAAFKLITPTTTPSPLALSTAKINAAGLIVVMVFGIGAAATLTSCGGTQVTKIEHAAYACATVDIGRTVPEVGMTIFQDVMAIVSAGQDGWENALAAIGIKYGEDALACAAKATYDALTAQQSSSIASAKTSAPTPAALRALTYIGERSYRYQ